MWCRYSTGKLQHGYAYDVPGKKNKTRVVTPQPLGRIRLSPAHQKFIFMGTRYDILEFMLSHENIVVEYDPDGLLSSPDSTPPSSAVPNSTSAKPNLLVSPTIVESRSATSTPVPSPPLSPISTGSESTKSGKSKRPMLVLDMFPQSAKSSHLQLDDMMKPFRHAMEHLPWLEVILEIRPRNPAIDDKKDPIKRVMLKSGLTLYEISKALEKSWRNPLPDAINFFKKPPPVEDDDDDSEGRSPDDDRNPWLDWLASKKINTFPTPKIVRRWEERNAIIPPGVVTPYVIEDVVKNGGIMIDKPEELARERKELEAREEREAAERAEASTSGLPQYDAASKDRLLESSERLYDWRDFSQGSK